jgi:hypothetical protein
VLENRVLREIFVPMRDEVTGGGWRELHNEELRNLYTSPSVDQVKEDEMGRTCSTREEACVLGFSGKARRK